MSRNSGRTLRLRRQKRVRKKVEGTSERPRLSVFRSNEHIYAQLIDDSTGRTLAAASSLGDKLKGAKKSTAEAVGKLIAERGKAAGVEAVVFDRGGFLFHGRVAALAEAARQGGLKF